MQIHTFSLGVWLWEHTANHTYILVLLKEHKVLREMLPNELLDYFLPNPRIQDIGHQTGISEHNAGASRPLLNTHSYYSVHSMSK